MLKDLRREVQHWRADAYVLSFPKCGRTWLRVMVAQVFAQHFGIRIPDSMRLHAHGSRLRGIPRVRVTHDWKNRETFAVDPDKRRFRRKAVVFMIRDPRDVVVSQYFHRLKRKRNYQGTLDDFVRHERASLADLVAYYNVWARERDHIDRFHVLRYEDLHAEPVDRLARVVEFLGVPDVPAGIIEAAVEACSFDRMQKMEQQGEFASGRLQARDASDPESYKARSGEVGGYRGHFSADLARYVDDYLQAHLDAYYAAYRAPTADDWPAEVSDE